MTYLARYLFNEQKEIKSGNKYGLIDHHLLGKECGEP
jgi:hypothetical protein